MRRFMLGWLLGVLAAMAVVAALVFGAAALGLRASPTLWFLVGMLLGGLGAPLGALWIEGHR